MNVVFIIPTGLGCSIGGHAGDATPAAKLIAQSCDRLILNPNVVNASDINEMPQNALYVEGGILDRFLMREVNLRESRGNSILVLANSPVGPETINAVNAARVTLGAKIVIEPLHTPLLMTGTFNDDETAGGHYSGLKELIDQVREIPSRDFDAIAIATPIEVAEGVALDYFKDSLGCVNPWGAIEAIVSKKVSSEFDKPTAHAPVESESTKSEDALFSILYSDIVDPRKAPEVCSSCYIHCVLKGLHKAPRVVLNGGLSGDDIDCMITPVGCIGPPHYACFDAGIPVIGVRENRTMLFDCSDRITYVENYLEASGFLNCMRAGIEIKSVRCD